MGSISRTEEDFQDGFDRLRLSDLRNWREWELFRPRVLTFPQRVYTVVVGVACLVLLVLQVSTTNSMSFVPFWSIMVAGSVLAQIRDGVGRRRLEARRRAAPFDQEQP